MGGVSGGEHLICITSELSFTVNFLTIAVNGKQLEHFMDESVIISQREKIGLYNFEIRGQSSF